MKTCLKTSLFLFVAAFCNVNLIAQSHFQIDEDLPLGTGAPKNVQCGVDQNNNVVTYPWYIPPASRKPGNTIATVTCGSFTLIFADDVLNTGQGYDGSTTQGQQMQNVACQVFTDLSNIFQIQGSPEVIFNQAFSNTQSQTLATGSVIYGNTITSGFAPCYMEIHAQTGNDPDASLPDGYVNTNIAYPYNTNLAPNSTVGNIDLYSVLLH